MTTLGLLFSRELGVARDVRYAWRSLLRTPGFTLVAVLTLALGVGANTAIFSVVNGVLLRPLPYAQPDRLVRLTARVPAASPDGRASESNRITAAEIDQVLPRLRTLSHLSFTSNLAFMTMARGGEAARLQGLRVGPTIFETLGVPAEIGRTFTVRQDADEMALVLAYAAWQRYFGGDPAIVGQTVTLTDAFAPPERARVVPYTVVGVMPRGFVLPDRQIEFWIPERSPAAGGGMIARLADGVSAAQAAAELGPMLRALRQHPAAATYSLDRVIDRAVAPVRPALLTLAVAVGFVLLIACVNVANLLLARAAGRQREIAVRIAVGASRRRLIGQFLTESLLLAALGGAGGVLLALLGTRLLKMLADTMPRMDLGLQLSFPRLDEIGVDPGVLGFTLLISAAVGVLCGIGPILGYGRLEHASGLRSRSDHARTRRLRGGLVVSEIALATMLLAGAGLLLQGFIRLTSTDPGYDPANVLTFQVNIGAARGRGAAAVAFADDVVERLRRVPGVRAAAFARQLPLIAIRESAWFRRTAALPSPPPPQNDSAPDARLVSRDYFDALGIRIIAGRGFDDRDRAGAPRVLLINQTLASRTFSGQRAIGEIVYAGRDANPWQIVGIVEDVRQFGLDRAPQPQFFADFRQWAPDDPVVFTFLGPYFAVRTDGRSSRLLPDIQAAVHRVDANAGVFNAATMGDLLANSVAQPRMYAALLGVFAAAATLLAAIGLYGVMAFAVNERTREIGIRMALGARAEDVRRLVLRQSGTLAGAGMLLGLGGAAGLTRFLRAFLFGLTPIDPATFGAVLLLFGLVAACAAYVPARRATRVDPMVALRTEEATVAHPAGSPRIRRVRPRISTDQRCLHPCPCAARTYPVSSVVIWSR